MAIPSLQSFILGDNENVTLGHARERLCEYFRDNIWADPPPSLGVRERCYHTAGNGWGHKFSEIDDLDGNVYPIIIGLAGGGVASHRYHYIHESRWCHDVV